MPLTDAAFARRVMIAVAILVAALAVWHLRSVLLLFFAASLVAVLLTSLSGMIRRLLPIGHGAGLALALALVLAIVGLAAYLFGAEVERQFSDLAARLPGAIEQAEQWLVQAGLRDDVLDLLRRAAPTPGAVVDFVSGAFSILSGVVSGVGLAIVGGIYLAVEPRMYREGMLRLWPATQRQRVRETIEAVGRALRSWLQGQLFAMAVIGTLSALGLWVIGMPSWLALGLIAGIVQFIPLAGPILAAIPALLVALSQGTDMLVWVALLYIGIQQVEGNLLTPMVQREVSALPPALTIFTLVTFALLFGAVGVILAVPLTVVGYALVAKLWVRDTLGEAVRLPGERSAVGGGSRAL
jgi:predicted PurR-regulated permease PerM